MYNVFYTSAAARQLRHLPPDVLPRIRHVIGTLASNPRTLHTEKLEGHPDAYRLRVGRYRIV